MERSKNFGEASGLCLFSWCFHSLCPRLGNTGKYCTVGRKKKNENPNKKQSARKNASQQLVFPMTSPMVLWIIPSSLLSHRVPPSNTSARCVDYVTDAHPFCCISLCGFKQPEHTSVVIEIATIIKHHQPCRSYLSVLLLNFFNWNLSEVWLWTTNLYIQRNPKYKYNTGILQ